MSKRPRLQTFKPQLATVDVSIAKPLRETRDDEQVERRSFYDTAQWRFHVRPAKLRADPLCQRCAFLGQMTAAVDVDHWQSIASGGHKTDPANLVSLCKAHHSEKTLMERNGTPFFEIAAATS